MHMKRKIVNPLLCLLLISALFVGIVTIPSFSEAEVNEPWDGGTGMDPIPGDNIWNTNGSWDIVDGDTIVHQDKTIIVNGDLTVDGTGSLTLINVTLKINVSFDGEFAIVVQNGGTFIIQDTDLNPLTKEDASNITSLNPNFRYSFGVYDASSTFDMRNSELHYCGYSTGTFWRDLGLSISSEYSIVEGNHIADCYRGLIVRDTNNVTVENNVIENIGNIGVYTNNVEYSYFRNNILSNVQDFSMYFYFSSNLNISYNTITNAPNAYGISLDGGITHDIFNNTIDNHNLGVFINGDISDTNILLCDIHKNDISNNEYGILLQGLNGQSAVQYIRIFDNTIYSNNVEGIRLYGEDTINGFTAVHDIYIYDNIVYDNGGGATDGHGLHFAIGTWWALGFIYCYDNEVRDNHNTANTGSGYYLEVVSQILIDGGLIARNDRNIWIEATDYVYVNNVTLEKGSGPGEVDVRIEDNYGNPPTVYFLNTTFDNTSAIVEDADSFLNVKRYLHVRVMQWGGGVDDADVWINNTWGNPDPPIPQPLNTGFGNDGWIRWLEVEEFNRTAGGTTYYTPHNIDAQTVSAIGSADATMNISREVAVFLSGPPTADNISSTSLTVFRGQEVNITANGSDPEDAEDNLIAHFEYKEPAGLDWVTLYMGSPTYIGTAPSGFWQIPFIPGSNAPLGPYEFRVKFEDPNGTFSNWISGFLVGVQNNLPIANAGPDDTAEAGTPYNFDGSGSYDYEGIVSYEWDINDSDGVSFSPPDLTGISPSYNYTIPGIYIVTLRVTDADAVTDLDTVQITVEDNEPPNVDAGPDGAVMKGNPFYFDASNSWDNVGIVWYNWSFDDGSYDNGTNITPQHIFAVSGNYSVILTCTDSVGNWAQDIVDVTVTNSLPPNASAGSDNSTNEDSPITFNGSLSDDDVGIVSYYWDIDDSNGLNWIAPDRSGMEVSWTYDTPGIYIVTLRVVDGDGGWDIDTLVVTVNDNTPPIANAGGPDSTEEDTSYMFDGTLSTDNSGSVEFYNWDFGDGNYSNGTNPQPSHAYTQPGFYTVTLNVSDAAGNWDTDTMGLTVLDITAPSANAGPDNSTDEDSSISFDGSASYDNVGIVDYKWDIDDSDGIDWASPDHTGSNPMHVYSAPNELGYTVTLNVTDSEGNWDIDFLNVVVYDVTPPSANAGFDATINEDASHMFDGWASTDNVAIVNYLWDIDSSDGVDWVTPDYLGASPSHIYPEPGIYIATLNVSDKAGHSSTDTVGITVKDITAPVANAGPDDSVDNNTAYPFDGSLSTDNSGTIEFYNWSFGDGIYANGTDPYPVHTYTTPGMYVVILTVTDESGNSDIVTLTITVIDIQDPLANGGVDDTVDEDSPYTFDGSLSDDDVGIINYAWDIDDTDGVDWSNPDYSGPNLWDPVHTYTEPGIYVVSLNVTDADGNWDTDTLQITVMDITHPISNAGVDDVINEDTPNNFDGSTSTDNVGIVNFAWDMDLSDGIDWQTPDYTGPTPSHTYLEPGTYTVTLNVTDAAGNWALDTVQISVLDVTVPIANAGMDVTIDEDLPHNFDGSGSSDNVGIASYAWDMDDDDGIDWQMPDHTGPTPSFEYSEPETYIVTLNVTDTSGNWYLDTMEVTVLDVTDPIPDAGPMGFVDEEAPYTFDGTNSTDNVDITSYAWDIDSNDGLDWDNPDLSGPSPLHIYYQPGIYIVTLNVSDSEGNWAMDTMTIEVVDITPPVAKAGADASINEDTLYSFDASGTTDNVGVVDYSWDIDNSNGLDWTNPDYSGVSPTHLFSEPGNYVVTLKTTDAEGNSDLDTVAIEVKLNDVKKPTLDVDFYDTMNEDWEYEFDASGSTDDTGIVTYEFDFGDGNKLSGSDPTVTHTYNDPGFYSFTVNITDTQGNWNTSTWFVMVRDTTPPLAPAAPTVVKVKSGGALDISWVANSDEDLEYYELHFSDDNAIFEKIGEFSPDILSYSHSGLINGNEYYYYLVAVDDDGLLSGNSDTVSETPDRDFDGDEIYDTEDEDDDGDGVNDNIDAFPFNSSEWSDFDDDGLGDNIDFDIDEDGYDNDNDVFNFDPNEWADFDGDGIGDNEDTDDDNDGISDTTDEYPLDSSKWKEPSDIMDMLWLILALVGIIVAIILAALYAKERGRNKKLLQNINEMKQAQIQYPQPEEKPTVAQPVAQAEMKTQEAVEKPKTQPKKAARQQAKKPKQAQKPKTQPPPTPTETFEIIEDEEPDAAPPPIPPEELPPPEPKKDTKKQPPPPPPE
jgi:PKD repeat protein